MVWLGEVQVNWNFVYVGVVSCHSYTTFRELKKDLEGKHYKINIW